MPDLGRGVLRLAHHRTAVHLTQKAIVPAQARQCVHLLSGLSCANASVAEGYFGGQRGIEALAVFGRLSPFILLATGMFFGFCNGIAASFTGDPAVFELVCSGLAIYPIYITLSAAVLIDTGVRRDRQRYFRNGICKRRPNAGMCLFRRTRGQICRHADRVGDRASAIALLCAGHVYRHVLHRERGNGSHSNEVNRPSPS